MANSNTDDDSRPRQLPRQPGSTGGVRNGIGLFLDYKLRHRDLVSKLIERPLLAPTNRMRDLG